MLKDIKQDWEELSTKQFKAALTTAIQLLGNASAQVSRLRRRKILKAINPKIQDLAEEGIFSNAAPYLFGKDFEPKIKNRADFFDGAVPLSPKEEVARQTEEGNLIGQKRASSPVDTQRRVTQEDWVLNTVQGYRIEFLSEPTERPPPQWGVALTSPEQSLLQEEVQKLLSKGAIEELAPRKADKGFYSSLFLVSKKDGGMRPVISL
uniref:Uncharacterized protein n=1 Tax=Amphimedon queenslandica TaxID=400682 RepID=A0A1X7TB02_AMPQE